MTNEEKALEQIRMQKQNAEDCLIEFDVLEFLEKVLEENNKLKTEIDEYKKALTTWNNANNEMLRFNQDLKDEIEQLKAELKQSIKLPYAAGTPLYFEFPKQGIVKDKIRRWQINEHGILFYSKGSAYPVEFIGKYIFLTQEEAEQSARNYLERLNATRTVIK